MKTAADFNADIPTAKIVVAFNNSERANINIEAPELHSGGIDHHAVGIAVEAILGAGLVHGFLIKPDGTGSLYLGGRIEQFTWRRATTLAPEPSTVGKNDIVSFHPDDHDGGDQ